MFRSSLLFFLFVTLCTRLQSGCFAMFCCRGVLSLSGRPRVRLNDGYSNLLISVSILSVDINVMSGRYIYIYRERERNTYTYFLSLFDLALLLPGIVCCNPGIYVPVYLYGISLFVFAASFPLRCHGFDAPA